MNQFHGNCIFWASESSSEAVSVPSEASAAGSPMIDVSDLPKNAAVKLAGNAMHVAQAGAIALIAALFLERV